MRPCGPYTFLSLMKLKNLLYFTAIALCLHKNCITEHACFCVGSTPAAVVFHQNVCLGQKPRDKYPNRGFLAPVQKYTSHSVQWAHSSPNFHPHSTKNHHITSFYCDYSESYSETALFAQISLLKVDDNSTTPSLVPNPAPSRS